jgi:hypothetical protein
MLYLQEKYHCTEGRYGRGGARGEIVKLSRLESVALISIKVVISVLILSIVIVSYDAFWTKHSLDQICLVKESKFSYWYGPAIEEFELQLHQELTLVMGFVGLTVLIIVGLMLIKRMRSGKAVRDMCTL